VSIAASSLGHYRSVSLQWNAFTWSEYLGVRAAEQEIEAVRLCTHTGRPLGTEDFVDELEEKTNRCLARWV